MPGLAFPPVGRLGFTSPPSPVLCSATTAPCPSRVASLLARSPIPWRLPRFVSLLQARWQPEAVRHRQGSWSAGTPALPAFWTKETRGSPKFPSSPCGSLPCSQTPVESVALALTRLGLLPSAPCTASAFPRSGPARLSLRSTTILISGLHHTAWGLAPSGSVLPSRGLHAEFATELLARLYSGGT